MRKLVIALGLVASVLALAGCYNKSCNDGCAEKAAAPCHQDLKGEK
jgi:hypothetical protein